MVGALLHGRIPQTQYYPKAPQTQYSPGNSMRVGSRTLCCVGESPLELCVPPDLIPLQITRGLALVPCLPHRIFSHSPRWAHFGSPLFALLKSAPSQALRFSLPTGLLYAPFPFLTELVWLLLSQISGLPFQIRSPLGLPLLIMIWGFGLYSVLLKQSISLTLSCQPCSSCSTPTQPPTCMSLSCHCLDGRYVKSFCLLLS